jgi:hypothetical protein
VQSSARLITLVGPSGKLLFDKSHENKDFLAAIQERNKKLGISRSIANVDLGLSEDESQDTSVKCDPGIQKVINGCFLPSNYSTLGIKLTEIIQSPLSSSLRVVQNSRV